VRAGTAALELLALCGLILVVGMFSPRATPTSAGVLAGLGLVGIVAAVGLLPAFGRRLAERGIPVWVRFVLVPGLTDDPTNVDGIARLVAPMKNVEWIEVLPFHQMGAFKWKALGLEYELSDTPTPSPELVARVMGQFRDAGCRAR